MGTKQQQNLEFDQPFHRQKIFDIIHLLKVQPFSSIIPVFHNQDDIS